MLCTFPQMQSKKVCAGIVWCHQNLRLNSINMSTSPPEEEKPTYAPTRFGLINNISTDSNLIKKLKPSVRIVKVALQDCFACTDWQMFRDAATQENNFSLEKYSSSVKTYISKCVDDDVLIAGSQVHPSGCFLLHFFHYYFLLSHTLGHHKLVTSTPNSGPLGAEPFLGKTSSEMM